MIQRLCRATTIVLFVLQAVSGAGQEVPGAARQGSALVGLWMARRDFGPEVRGRVDLHVDGTSAYAEIGGYTAAVTVLDDGVRFEVAGDRGAFRASLGPDGLTNRAEIAGHWIQPPTAANGARFASPVTLHRVRAGHWRGEVQPLPDRMTFFLALSREPDGSVRGFLRNPEANFGRHFQIERVVSVGDEVVIEEVGQPEARLRGSFDPDRRNLALWIPDAGGTFDFRKVEEDAGSSFSPRPGMEFPYQYRPPTTGEDGWAVASLIDVGIDVGTIERMIQAIIDTPATAIDTPYFHAVLMARHGRLVLEEYFHGFTAEDTHDTRSAAKTMTSTLIGAALRRGAPLGLDSGVYSIMNGGELPPGLDPRKARMTLRHLLTMTPGLACDDNDADSPGAEWVMQSQPEDWVEYTLGLPMAAEPGSRVTYCSASTNLAGATLAKATGTWLPELFDQAVASPLGIHRYYWNLMPGGEGYGGGGLYIRGRDFLKMAQLFLDGGRWNGQSILSDDWVRDALEPANEMFNQGYGYAWWIINFPLGDGTVAAAYAGGNGGQYSMVIPEHDLALVFFAGNYNQRTTHEAKREQIPKFILTAIRDAASTAAPDAEATEERPSVR